MADIREILQSNNDNPIALYGLGTETERFLSEWGGKLTVTGLLDGFRESGELYGKPILSFQGVMDQGVKLIIVVARPGSCKAIVKRIGAICKENNIALFDVRGKNLLEENKVSYDFLHVEGKTKKELLEKIANAEVISFDLFDTLVTRQVFSYTDVFDLVNLSLEKKGIFISGFSGLRLAAEKELSKDAAPTLEAIYTYMLAELAGSKGACDWHKNEDQMTKHVKEDSPCWKADANYFAELEWEIDFSTLLPREEVCKIFRKAVSCGKRVIITTDSYYRIGQIRKILERLQIDGYTDILVSCEYGTGKTQQLFDILLSRGRGKKFLHIGDDEWADIRMADARGIDS